MTTGGVSENNWNLSRLATAAERIADALEAMLEEAKGWYIYDIIEEQRATLLIGEDEANARAARLNSIEPGRYEVRRQV